MGHVLTSLTTGVGGGGAQQQGSNIALRDRGARGKHQRQPPVSVATSGQSSTMPYRVAKFTKQQKIKVTWLSRLIARCLNSPPSHESVQLWISGQTNEHHRESFPWRYSQRLSRR
ncbi:hypothetical protein ACOMHN_037194 [Nucella lapillus]